MRPKKKWRQKANLVLEPSHQIRKGGGKPPGTEDRELPPFTGLPFIKDGDKKGSELEV